MMTLSSGVALLATLVLPSLIFIPTTTTAWTVPIQRVSRPVILLITTTSTSTASSTTTTTAASCLSATLTTNVDGDDGDSDDPVIQPTVMVNGQDMFDSTATKARNNNNNNNNDDDDEETIRTVQRNQEIMGATAAMAVKTETPLEQTLQHVATALQNLELITPTGQDSSSYTTLTKEEIAPLVQGKRVALYFAAGWCPMCREFEFMLPQYTKALMESAQPIQFIYVSSDTSLEFQLDRMSKLGMTLGVPPTVAQKLKAQYGIWAGREARNFVDCGTMRRSGVPALIVLDTQGNELTFLNVESETIAAMADWPLDDPRGIF